MKSEKKQKKLLFSVYIDWIELLINFFINKTGLYKILYCVTKVHHISVRRDVVVVCGQLHTIHTTDQAACLQPVRNYKQLSEHIVEI